MTKEELERSFHQDTLICENYKRCLEYTKGNIYRMAILMGVNHKTVRNGLKRFALYAVDYRSENKPERSIYGS
jgi:hypothetical protein